MPEKIEAGNELLIALAEVDTLLGLARQASSDKDEDSYSLFLKCALLLLMAKFECFLEEVASEYIELLKRLNPPRTTLPLDLSVNYVLRRLSDLETLYRTNKTNEYPDRINEISEFWTDKNSSCLEVSCQFNYGKHGEKEVEKLLKRIGIADPFDRFAVSEREIGKESDSIVDVAGTIQSLTAIRNNVLHQNATPTLTDVLLDEQKKCLSIFAAKLVEHLDGSLKSYRTP
jgi:hypothetical protein